MLCTTVLSVGSSCIVQESVRLVTCAYSWGLYLPKSVPGDHAGLLAGDQDFRHLSCALNAVLSFPWPKAI